MIFAIWLGEEFKNTAPLMFELLTEKTRYKFLISHKGYFKWMLKEKI